MEYKIAVKRNGRFVIQPGTYTSEEVGALCARGEYVTFIQDGPTAVRHLKSQGAGY